MIERGGERISPERIENGFMASKGLQERQLPELVAQFTGWRSVLS
jgi:hypothetical protein